LKKRKISDYSLINLANIFEEMGEYEKAEKILHQRLSKLSIEQMNEKYNCYDLLGTLAGRNGNFQQAIKYHLQSIQLQKQILPIDQKQLALTYNNLGSSYGMNGQFDSALSNLFESEKIISELFDDQNHLLFAGTYENIANCYFNQNKFDIRQYNNIPENSPEYIEYYMSVGNIFGSNKQFHEAINYHRKAIEIVQRVYPSDHQLLAFCYNNLGKDYGDQKQYQLAKENYQQALNIYQQILSNDHPEMIRTQENMDEIYMDMWTEVGKLLLITVIIMLSIVFFFFI
jgi:tetratricopeptide (TPR) repeat protein